MSSPKKIVVCSRSFRLIDFHISDERPQREKSDDDDDDGGNLRFPSQPSLSGAGGSCASGAYDREAVKQGVPAKPAYANEVGKRQSPCFKQSPAPAPALVAFTSDNN